MKIRIGHVSNSSSSSFCLFGAHIKDQYALQELGSKLDVFVDLDGLTYENVDKLKEGLAKYGLDGEIDGECFEYGYIGLALSNMKPDETRREFENRAKNLISNLTDEKCSWVVDTIEY